MIPQSKINEIKDYLNRSENPLIFYDDDVDGLCSYLLFKKLKPNAKGVILKLPPKDEIRYIEKIERIRPDYIFILDKAVMSQEFIDKINVPIIWIDHHEPIKRKGIHYYNPKIYDKKDKKAVAYWCYKIFKDLCDEKDKDWGLFIGSIGCIADYYVPDFIKEFKKFKLIKSEDIEEILYKDKVGEIVKIFSFMLKGKMEDIKKSIRILVDLKKPDDLLNEKFILKRFEKFNKEYKSLLDKALKEKGKGKVFIFIYPSSKTSFTRDLSNELLYRVKKEIIIVGREKTNEVKVSLRSRNVDLREILRKALKGIRGYGGGHFNAVGCTVVKEDFEKFIGVIKREV
jgi:single-stranded DNA-specific DHH superfamily exonuclease